MQFLHGMMNSYVSIVVAMVVVRLAEDSRRFGHECRMRDSERCEGSGIGRGP